MSSIDRAVRRLEEWQKGKPPLVAAFGVIAADFAGSAYELGKEFRRSKFYAKLPPLPPVDEWLKIYRRSRMSRVRILVAFGFSETEAMAFSCALSSFGAMRRSPESLREHLQGLPNEQWGELITSSREFADAWKEEAVEAVRCFATDEIEFPDDFEDTFALPEYQFYFRVWFPCWVQYHEYPTRLLRRARAGEVDAIDKLLRIDKGVVRDPRIAEHLHRLSSSGRLSMGRLGRALGGRPAGSWKRSKVKRSMAALVVEVAAGFQCRLITDVLELFDAVALLSGKHSDPDLPAGETLTKAIQRGRKPWKEAMAGQKEK